MTSTAVPLIYIDERPWPERAQEEAEAFVRRATARDGKPPLSDRTISEVARKVLKAIGRPAPPKEAE